MSICDDYYKIVNSKSLNPKADLKELIASENGKLIGGYNKSTASGEIQNRLESFYQQRKAIDENLKTANPKEKTILTNQRNKIEAKIRDFQDINSRSIGKILDLHERDMARWDASKPMTNVSRDTIGDLELRHEAYSELASPDTNWLLNKDELKEAGKNSNSPEAKRLRKLQGIANQSSRVLPSIRARMSELSDELGDKYGVENLSEKKIEGFSGLSGALQKNLMALNDSNSSHAQLIYKLVITALGKAHAKSYDLKKSFVSDYNKVTDKLGIDKVEGLFHRSTKDSTGKTIKTGDVTQRFTYDFSNKVDNALSDYDEAIGRHRIVGWEKSGKLIKGEAEKAGKRILNVAIPIDIDRLDAGDKTHEDELKKVLGSDFDMYVNKAREKDADYARDQEVELGLGMESGKTLNALREEHEKWRINNDPREIIDRLGTSEQGEGRVNFDRLVFVPKDLKHIDDNYLEIRKNPEMSRMYNKLINLQDMLSAYIPKGEARRLDDGAFNLIEKTATRKLFDAGLKGWANSFYDKQLKTITDVKPSDKSQTYKSGLRFVTNEGLKSRVDEKALSLEAKLGRDLTPIEREDMRLNIINDVVSNSDSNLGKTISVYADAAMKLKYKLEMAEPLQYLKKLIEFNPDLLKQTGEDITKNTLKAHDNLMDVVNNTFDHLYGNKTSIPEVKLWKQLTTEEKIRKAQIEDALDSNEVNRKKELATTLDKKATNIKYDAIKQELQGRMEKIGNHVYLSGIADEIKNITRVAFIAYKLHSIIIDFAARTTRLSEEAARGQFLDTANLTKALGYIGVNFMGKLITLNSVHTAPFELISKIVNKYGLVDYEAFNMANRDSIAKYGIAQALDPKFLQKSKEFGLQASLGLGCLDHIKVFQGGKEISLLDAIMHNNGDLPADLTDKDGKKLYQDGTLGDSIIPIKIAGRRVNGLYNSETDPLLFNNHWYGRQILFFKQFLPMMMYDIYRGERQDIFSPTDRSTGQIASVGKYFKSKWDSGEIGQSMIREVGATVNLLLNPILRNTRLGITERGDFDASDVQTMRSASQKLCNILLMTAMTAYFRNVWGQKKHKDDATKLLLQDIDDVRNSLITALPVLDFNFKNKTISWANMMRQAESIAPALTYTAKTAKDIIQGFWQDYAGTANIKESPAANAIGIPSKGVQKIIENTPIVGNVTKTIEMITGHTPKKHKKK